MRRILLPILAASPVFISLAWRFESSKDVAAEQAEEIIQTTKTHEEVADIDRAPAGQVLAKGNNEKPHKIIGETNLVTNKKKLEALRSCYETQNCEFPNTDPRSYGISVGRAIEEQLLQLVTSVSARDDSQNEEVSRIARENLKIADGFVKEAALRLMATQEPNNENLESILKDVLDSPEAGLVPEALEQLKRYTSASDQARVNEALLRVMKSGSFAVRDMLAENIETVITADNRDVYEDALKDFSPTSQVYVHIQRALEK